MKILLYIIIIALMILMIPVIQNDFVLSGIYALVIAVTILIRRHKNDLTFLIFGFVGLLLSEYFFISTGVETFNRRTLLGVMPLWLPFLWAYVFVAIGRCFKIINDYRL